MTVADPGDGPARVLVVDDDQVVRDIVCEIVISLGCIAESARDGADALDRFRPGRYRLVITDLAMPGMNGLQLARRLRTLETSLPILMFSAAAGTSEEQIESCGIALVRKPDVEALTQLVRRTLGRP